MQRLESHLQRLEEKSVKMKELNDAALSSGSWDGAMKLWDVFKV